VRPGRDRGADIERPHGERALYRAAVSSSQILAFLLSAEALLIVPGPSVLFVVSRGVAYGRRAAVATVAGNTLGCGVQVIAVAAGLGAVVATSGTVFTAMKLIGGAYLVYLGVRAWRDRRSLSAAIVARSAVPVRSTSRLVRDGFLVGVSNPKTTLFFLAVLPQFVRPAAGHPTLQLLVLGMLFCVLALLSDSAYGVAAGTVRTWFDRSPRRLETMGGIGGLVMVALGLRLVLTGRKD
jgi:threonine/homoserine/homoserine lactone efflux protein